MESQIRTIGLLITFVAIIYALRRGRDMPALVFLALAPLSYFSQNVFVVLSPAKLMGLIFLGALVLKPRYLSSFRNKYLGAFPVRHPSELRLRIPMFEAHQVRESNLEIECLVRHAGDRTGFPLEFVRVDGFVASPSARILSQFDEENAARLRKGRMSKTFWIEKERSGRPVAMLIGKDAVEYEDLFAVRMIMGRERRIGFVANDRRDLARLGRPNEMDSLSPDATARTWRPLHLRRVGDNSHGEIAIDRRIGVAGIGRC